MRSGRHLFAGALAAALLCDAARADEAATDASVPAPRPAVHIDDASVPDSVRTPGDFDDGIKEADICAEPTTTPAVPAPALCEAAFAERRIADAYRYEYACVFLVPTTIGGRLTKKNLWLQPATETHWKKALDGAILQRVCNSELSVAQAQRDIAGDWVRAYRRYMLPNDPLIAQVQQPKYDPKSDPGRSRAVRGIVQDVVPADVPQSGPNNQPIEASVIQDNTQGGGGGGGSGGPQGNGNGNGGGMRRGGPFPPGVGGRASRSGGRRGALR